MKIRKIACILFITLLFQIIPIPGIDLRLGKKVFAEEQLLSNIVLDSNAYSLYVGESHNSVVVAVYTDVYSTSTSVDITHQTIFVSSDPSIAMVSPGGIVTGVTPGVATITAMFSGKSADVIVTINSNLNNPGIGLIGEYYDNMDLTNLKLTRLDTIVNFNWGSRSPDTLIDKDTFSVRWSGKLLVKYSENYNFYTQTHGGVRLWINDKLIIDDWKENGMKNNTASIFLTEGITYDIKMEYCNDHGGAVASISWSSPNQPKEIIPQGQLYPVGTPKNVLIQTSETEINLSWDPIVGANGYDIEVDGKIIDNGNLTNFIHRNLIPGTQHTYRLRSRNNSISGIWSPTITESTLLSIPSNIKTTTSLTTINISWDAVTGASGYDIEVDGSIINNDNYTSYIHTNLNNGTEHTYKVRARSSSTIGSWSTSVLETTLLPAPSNISVESTDNSILIAWEQVLGTKFYEIEVDEIIISNIFSTSYMHINLLSSSKHTYRIRTVNSGGQGVWSASLTKITMPGIPANINAYATETSISISWDPTDGANGYDVEVDGGILDNGACSIYLHSELIPGSEHKYRVRAKNSDGPGQWTEYIARVAMSEAQVNINTAIMDTSVSLYWNEVEGATGYDIEADGVIIDTGATKEYTHTDLLPNTKHAYRVRAKNSVSIGGWSALISVTTRPETPSNISVVCTNNNAVISWNTIDGSTGYDIEVDGVIVNNGLKIEYLHNGLIPNTLHKYRVRAKNTDIHGQWSNEITATTLPDNHIVLNKTISDNSIAINWGNISGALSYDVEVDGVILENGINTSFIHSGLLPYTLHTYRVRAKNSGGAGEWSELYRVTTGISIPANIIATPADTSITLIWDEVTGATGYDIEIDGSTIDNGPSTVFIHNDMVIGESHSYRVRAKTFNGTGSWSDFITKSTAPITGNGIGLRGEYFDNIDLTDLKVTRLDTMVVFDWRKGSPDSLIDSDTFSTRWSGQIQPRYSENYTFYTETHGGVRLWVDGKLIIDQWFTNDMIRLSGTIELKAGKKYDIIMEHNHGNGVASAKLLWSSASQVKEIIPKNHLYPVGTPVNVTASASYDSITVAWDLAFNATGYDIEVDGVILDNQTNTFYNHNNLSEGIQHSYRVRARCGEFLSEWSNPVVKTTLNGIPSGLTAKASFTSISLSWNAVDESSVYDIEVDEAIINNGTSTSFIHSNIMPGSKHTYRVRARNSNAIGAWGEKISEITLLQKPVIITTTAQETEITLLWDVVSNANIYDIEVDGSLFDSVSSTSYTHTGLMPGLNHNYRIRARNNETTGEWSNNIVLSTLPDVPGNIMAIPTSNSITITWDAVTGSTGYDIEVQGTIVNNGTSNTYTHNGLSANTQRTYRVRAINNSGAGKWSDLFAITTLPLVPTDLSTVVSDTSAAFSWNASAGATAYDLEIDGALFTGINNTVYVHSGLVSNTTHICRIRSKNADGASDWSQEISFTTLPSIPDNIIAYAGSTTVTLSWSNVEGATGYDIEADGQIVNSITETYYTHTELNPSSLHTYRIRAKSDTGESAWSVEVTKYTFPAVPANINATSSSSVIIVSWSTVVGAFGYDIEVDGKAIDNELSTSYTHTELVPNSEHSYRIRARNAAGAGEWSELITKVTQIGTPEIISVSASSTSMVISWNSISGAQGYDILIDGMVISNENNTTYIHNGLEPNTYHVYRVRAKAYDIAGEWSSAVSKVTMPGIPSNLNAKALSTQITVTWDNVSGATDYEILADGVLFDAGESNFYLHSGLLPNTIHTYVVRSKNENGYSDWSNPLNKMTTPDIPKNLKAISKTNEMSLTWDAVPGVTSYDLEVDGSIIEGIKTTSYIHVGLEPNTRHSYRIRARNDSGTSEWSELLEKNTVPELTVNVGTDNMFNFVVVAPKKKDVTKRTIIVNYNPDELDIVDLCAMTPSQDIKEGKIEGTNITVSKFIPGEIIFTIENADKTVVNSIKFMAKVNVNSKVTYVVE